MCAVRTITNGSYSFLHEAINYNTHPVRLVGSIGSGRRTLCEQVGEDLSHEVRIYDDPKVLAIRELQAEVKNLMRPRMYVINLDGANQSVVNALLKVLEEPPNNAKFIILSTWGDSVIDTITSRCQVIFMERYDTDQLVRLTTSKTEFLADVLREPGDIVRAVPLAVELKEQAHKIVYNIKNANAANIVAKLAPSVDTDTFDLLMKFIHAELWDVLHQGYTKNGASAYSADKALKGAKVLSDNIRLWAQGTISKNNLKDKVLVELGEVLR